jgi:hypothetical protein
MSEKKVEESKVEDSKVEDSKVEENKPQDNELAKLIANGFKTLQDSIKTLQGNENIDDSKVKTLIPKIPEKVEDEEELKTKKDSFSWGKLWSKVWRGE